MNWLKLFGLLVAFTFVVATAEGTRKKIRIHIPQKVKHVYHHKKIYITNHPASSQYAPAYLPMAESTLKMPNAVFVPTPKSLPPLAVFEDRGSKHLQTVASPESKILPMYRARGFYGPASEWEDQEYDLVPPSGPSGPSDNSFLPTAFSEAVTPIPSSDYSVKRIRVIKGNGSHRKKKVVIKRKPKRVTIQNLAKEEARHPVLSYYKQFYADVNDVGIIRKIKKPKRVEKIVDGDTEHIHTFSEEHIHKLVFDEPQKISGIAGIDSVSGVSALTEANPLLSIKNSQVLSLGHTKVKPFSNFNTISTSGAIGSLGTPSNMEYMGYDPQEVSHDHVFHDHGEISSAVDITKDSLSRPPKVTYDNKGLKIFDSELITKSHQRNKWSSQNNILQPVTSSPGQDFSYYENIYTTTNRPKKIRHPKKPPTKFSDDSSLEFDNGVSDFHLVPYLKFKKESKHKTYDLPSYYDQERQFNLYREGKTSGSVLPSLLNFLESPLKAQKNIYMDARPTASIPFSTNKDLNSLSFLQDVHNHASLENAYDKDNMLSWPVQSKGKKKSISTQNISFGGQDYKTVIDHMTDTYEPEILKPKNLREPSSTLINNRWTDIATRSPSLFIIKENSPLHEYYPAMSLKAFRDDHLSEASNNNLMISDPSSTPLVDTLVPTDTTMISTPAYYINSPVETTTTSSQSRKRLRSRKLRPRISQGFEQIQIENAPSNDVKISDSSSRQSHVSQTTIFQNAKYPRSRHIPKNLSDNVQNDDSGILPVRSNFKYGDKL